MDSKNTIRSNHSRGVAMFVVLGVVVVLSLLGYVGLRLAKGESDQSGAAVDLKSQRLTAIAGLNMAVAQLGRSDVNLVAIVNEFRASVLTGSVKEWIVFGATPLSLSSTDPGFTTSLGSDNSSCKVRILGIEEIGASSTLDITLESSGRGRSGDVHTAVATYRMSGLNSRISTTSLGPNNGLHSTGGFNGSGFNQKVNVDGGIYSGGGTLMLQPPAGSNTSTRIRSAGNVTLNSDITLAENSIIGGDLWLNGGDATFDKNLIVGGNLLNNQVLKVKGSMIFSGSTSSGYRSGTIEVGKDFLVNGARFIIEGPLTVGATGTTTSKAWFTQGINIEQTGTRTINGSMYIRNTDGLADGLRGFDIKQDLKYEGTTGFGGVLRLNTTDVDRNAYLDRPIRGGNSSMSGGVGLNVDGRSILLEGISENNSQNHTFGGDVYLRATGQSGLNGSFTFSSNVSINGSQSSDWATKWSFSGGTKNWSYTASDCSTLRSKLDIQNASSVSCRTSDSLVPSWVASTPSVITATEMGYSAADLDLTQGNNASSLITTGNFPAGFMNTAKWSAIKAASGSCVTSSYRPSASEIKCVYDKERQAYASNPSTYNGPLYRGTDGKRKFLVINIDGSWSTGGVPTDLVIQKGVHVMFILNAGQSNLTSWYTNVEGSTQILFINESPGSFGWNGTVNGFVQFNVPNSSIQLNGNMVLNGALESAQASSQLQPNSGNLTISINNDQARTVRDEIVMAFTGSSTGSSDDVIRFSGDVGRVVGTTRELTTNDGWVQFVRLGEFR